MRLAAAAVLLALAPAVARAQAFDGTQGVDTFTGPLVAASRILGLGGAYVAVAEGLDGAEANPAAVAQRNRHLARGWDWDWALTWYVPAAGQIGRQDLGNDGYEDAGLSGIGNGQVGLSYQYGRFGIGAYGGGWNLAAIRTGVGSVEMEYAHGSLAAGGTFLRETLVLGASLTSVSGIVRVAAPPAAPAEVEYKGSTIRVGGLYRPRGVPWRLGAAVDFAATAKAVGDRSALPVATPSEFVFPWMVSLGIAAWVGPNADRFNEPPPTDLERHPEWGPGPEWQDTNRRPVLLSAQLDVVGPAPGAVTMESVLLPTVPAQRSGAHASLVPRAGAEAEPLPEWLRVRGGTYLEPSRTGGTPRLHATFGFDVRVPFPFQDLRLGLSGDLAERYQNVSLGLGFWSLLGPAPPVVPAAR